MARDSKAKGGLTGGIINAMLYLLCFPFAKQCGPGAIVQRAKAAPHAYRENVKLYSIYDIKLPFLLRNSPNVSMTDPAWPWMKRESKRWGWGAENCKEAEIVWVKAWGQLEQWRIQRGIEKN